MKLPAFLAAHALATPDREAVYCGGIRLTFKALHEESTRLACALCERGIRIGDRVAVWLHNRVEFAVAFAAIVKAGAIAVMVNPRLSAAELGYILRDSTPAAVIFERETALSLESSGVRVGVQINVDDEAFRSLSPTGRLPEVPFEFDDCQISYTSGTTGMPKGAIITQSNYITSNGWLNAAEWGMTAKDRVLTTTPLAHRTAFSRLMNTFIIGSSIVVMQRFDAKEAAHLIESERITLLGMIPTVGRMLLPEIEAAPEKFRNLRLAVVTAEAFPLEVKRRLLAALPHVQLHSFFASTEASAITTLGPEEQFVKAASTGRVKAGVEVKLVDEAGMEVPAGSAGEILVRSGPPGRYLTMRAYFNNPKANAEAFKDGWFHTGDIGRFDEDGYLYIVDRKKDMVLSGGYNIYSKEVEAVILEIPGVLDAAVVGVPDSLYGEAVAAFVELQPGVRLDAERVVQHCRERIASYKKPRYVQFVPSLPRNGSGKVMKFQLREQFDAKNAA